MRASSIIVAISLSLAFFSSPAKAATACPGICNGSSCNGYLVVETQCRSLVINLLTACWEWPEPCYLFPFAQADEGGEFDQLSLLERPIHRQGGLDGSQCHHQRPREADAANEPPAAPDLETIRATEVPARS